MKEQRSRVAFYRSVSFMEDGQAVSCGIVQCASNRLNMQRWQHSQCLQNATRWQRHCGKGATEIPANSA